MLLPLQLDPTVTTDYTEHSVTCPLTERYPNAQNIVPVSIPAVASGRGWRSVISTEMGRVPGRWWLARADSPAHATADVLVGVVQLRHDHLADPVQQLGAAPLHLSDHILTAHTESVANYYIHTTF